LQDHDAEGVDEREHWTLREFRWTKKMMQKSGFGTERKLMETALGGVFVST